jgi:hypothetical protein
MHDCKQKNVEISSFTKLREILYTDSRDTLVLLFVTSYYYNCRTDGNTSPGNYSL